MARREHRSFIDPGKVESFVPATRNADANGASADLKGYDSGLFSVNVGVEGITLDGSNYIDVFFEHADDDGTGNPGAFAVCAAPDLLGPAALGADIAGAIRFDAVAEAPAHHLVAYRGSKRHVRARLDFVGTHATGTPTAVTIYRLHKGELNRS